MSPLRRPLPRPYLAGVALLLIVMVVIGAYAVTLLVRGGAAFPVEVYGHVDFDAVRQAALAEPRPAAAALQGSLDFEVGDVAAGEAAGVSAGDVIARGDVGVTDSVAAALPAQSRGLLESARAWSAREDWARSLAAYGELQRRHPDIGAIIAERAAVLSWAGEHGSAGLVYADAAAAAPQDAGLWLRAAQNYWWAGRALAADSALTRYLQRVPGDAAALDLRRQVRAAAAPPLRTAERWASESGSVFEQLVFARALVRDARYGEALPVYRRALAAGAPDSVRLELASAATAADSTDVAQAALSAFLADNPERDDVRLSLARSLAWSQKYDAAITELDVLLTGNRDAELEFERAQLLVWTGREAEAERALRSVIAAAPDHVPARQALGDVMRWRGNLVAAEEQYRAITALEPENADVAALLSEVEEAQRAAQRALLPPAQTTVAIDAVSDRSGFRWLEARGEQVVVAGRTSFTLAALQTVPGYQVGSRLSTTPGYGGGIGISHPFGSTVVAELGAGVSNYGYLGTFPRLTGAVRFTDLLGLSTELRVTHEPAVRRAGTLLALHARAMSTRGEATIAGNVHGFQLWSRVEVESFDSDLGRSGRQSASVAVRRPLGAGFSALAGVSALRTDRAAPSLPGWGAIHWSPELYVQPTGGLAYDVVHERWTLSATAQGGWAYAQERALDQRFGSSSFPVFSAGIDASWRTGPLVLSGGVQYGGAVDDGYRATSLRLQASYLFR